VPLLSINVRISPELPKTLKIGIFDMFVSNNIPFTFQKGKPVSMEDTENFRAPPDTESSF
jgi:hypothetical protein